MGTFFKCGLSYDRDKKKTNVNNCPKRRYLRTLIFCTWKFVQLISGRFFMAKPGDAPFLYQVCTRMYRMTMKVVSFTGGATGVYAVLRAIVTGNASGEIPLAWKVLNRLSIFFAYLLGKIGGLQINKSE